MGEDELSKTPQSKKFQDWLLPI